MAGRYNTWVRRKLAERIRNNGGYFARHNQRQALSWCVRVYADIGSVEEAAKLMVEHGHFISETHLNLQVPDFAERVGEIVDGEGPRRLWEYAQELLQADLTDDEGLRMWSPDTARRCGFDYAGPGADRPFDMALEGWGGGGKHVGLLQFEGEDLRMSANDLADMIDPDTVKDPSGYTNTWCRKLMGIMDELDECLTTKAATEQALYYMVDHIMQELEE